MSQELTIEGKTYISSKRASEISGYAQDYIGQLARKQLIDAQRVGGLWYVFLDSLNSYQKQAAEYKPQPPVFHSALYTSPDSVISLEGKEYVSAARAAELTGYHQDYVGQLARAGTVLSRQIGNRWYVEREGILAHKANKDSLLAAVQAESVGITRPRLDIPAPAAEESYTYFSDTRDLLPTSHEEIENDLTSRSHLSSSAIEKKEYTRVPIRRMSTQDVAPYRPRTSSRPRRSSSRPLYLAAGALATIVVVLTVGFTSIKSGSTYTVANRIQNSATALEAIGSLEFIADFIERFVPSLQYHR